MFPCKKDVSSRCWRGPLPSRARTRSHGRGRCNWPRTGLSHSHHGFGRVGSLETRTRRNPFDSIVSNISVSSMRPSTASSFLSSFSSSDPSSPAAVPLSCPRPSTSTGLHERGDDASQVSNNISTRGSKDSVFGAADTDLRPAQLFQSESQVKNASLRDFHQQILKVRSGRSLVGKKRPARTKPSPSWSDGDSCSSMSSSAVPSAASVAHNPDASTEDKIVEEHFQMRLDKGATSCFEQFDGRIVEETIKNRKPIHPRTNNVSENGFPQIKVEKDPSDALERTVPSPPAAGKPTCESPLIVEDTAASYPATTHQSSTPSSGKECVTSNALSVTANDREVQEGVPMTDPVSKPPHSDLLTNRAKRELVPVCEVNSASPACVMGSKAIDAVSTANMPAEITSGSTLSVSTITSSAETRLTAGSSAPKDASVSQRGLSTPPTPYARILPVPRPVPNSDPPPKPVTLEEISNSRKLISAGAIIIAKPTRMQASDSSIAKPNSSAKIAATGSNPYPALKRPTRLYFCDACRINCSSENALKMHMKSPLHQKKIRSPLSCKSQRVSSSSSLGAVAIQHKRPGSEFEVASTKLKILKRKDPGSEFQSARDPIPAKLEKNIEGTPIVPSVQMERTDKRIIQQGLDGSYTILPDKATTGKSVDDPVEVDSPVSVESSTQPEEPDVKHEEIDLTKESPYYCSVCMVDCVTPMAFASHTTDISHRQKALQREVEKSLKAENAKLQGQDHRNVTADDQMTTQFFYYCKVCDLHLQEVSKVSHEKGRLHKQNVIKRLRGERVGKPAAKTGHATQAAAGDEQEGHVVQAILDKCEEPLIGLQYVKEVHQKGNPTPWFLCQLCEVQLDIQQGEMMTRHLVGVKHRKKYIRVNYPEYYSIVENHTHQSRPETAAMVEEYAMAIEAEEGRAKVTVIYRGTPPRTAGTNNGSKKAKVPPPLKLQAAQAQPDSTGADFQDFCSQKLRESIVDLMTASLQGSAQREKLNCHPTSQQHMQPQLPKAESGARYWNVGAGYPNTGPGYPQSCSGYPPGHHGYPQNSPGYFMGGVLEQQMVPMHAGGAGYVPSRSADSTVPPAGQACAPENGFGSFDSTSKPAEVGEGAAHAPHRQQGYLQDGYAGWMQATAGLAANSQGCVPVVSPLDISPSPHVMQTTFAVPHGDPGASMLDRCSIPAPPARVQSRHGSNSSEELPSASFTKDLLVEADESAGSAQMSCSGSSPSSDDSDQPSASFTLDLLERDKPGKERLRKVKKDCLTPKVCVSTRPSPRVPFQENASTAQSLHSLGTPAAPMSSVPAANVGLPGPLVPPAVPGYIPSYAPPFQPQAQGVQMPGLPMLPSPATAQHCILPPIVNLHVPPPGYAVPGAPAQSSPAVVPQMGFGTNSPPAAPPSGLRSQMVPAQSASHPVHQPAASCSIQQSNHFACPPLPARPSLAERVMPSSQCVVTNKEEAELAQKVSEALGQALKNFRTKQEKGKKTHAS